MFSVSLGSRLCLAKSSNLREADLVSKCSGTLECTLEFLTAAFFSPSLFSFGSAVGRRLTATIAPGPLDLSEAAKLKEVEFRYAGRNIQRLTTTLRTAKSTSLQTIAITIPQCHPGQPGTGNDPWGMAGDQLLDQLWTPCSICPKIAYKEDWVPKGFEELVSGLLPKLASKGAVNGV